ncbi:MAG: hypothetical protein FJ320_05865 [SAR202 cluster bacterium]|nr:hypothetical protein [SAR202 cluster bacterium]
MDLRTLRPLVRLFIPLLALAGLAFFIVAAGSDETPTTAATSTPTRPATTNTPTQGATTAGPTATPTRGATTGAPTATPTRAAPTATATTASKVPVKPRLVIALPAPAEQQTVPYTQSQVSEKLNGQYDHLIGRNITTNEEQPELATTWSVAPNGKD